MEKTFVIEEVEGFLEAYRSSDGKMIAYTEAGDEAAKRVLIDEVSKHGWEYEGQNDAE